MQIVKRDFANFDVFPDPPKRVTVHLLTSWNSCVKDKRDAMHEGPGPGT